MELNAKKSHTDAAAKGKYEQLKSEQQKEIEVMIDGGKKVPKGADRMLALIKTEQD